MPLPRMTIRRWMIAVAVMGLIAGTVVPIRRKAVFYERLSNDHFRLCHETYPYMGSSRDHSRDTLKWLRLAGYHMELSGKYRLASRHPWLPVPPDSPEPK